MRTVLLTGFDAFGGDQINPSADAVRSVAAAWVREERLVTDILPVSFDGAAARLRELIHTHTPDLIVSVGLAGGRARVGVERVAINLADARIPDNSGAQPRDAECVTGAPAAYFATAPVKAIVAALDQAGIPAELSYSAGTFVCNHVFYTARHSAPHARSVFVHVPWAHGQGRPTDPSLSSEEIEAAIHIAVATMCDTERDLDTAGGTLH